MTSPETQSSVRTAAQLRRAFLDFFIKNGHTEVPSSPLVPDDPSLLFTTAGMVQFKPYYSLAGDVPYTRATSIQKCLRLTDIDNVGLTPRHDTFFEMLGNFSFGARSKGAYFKEEAIAFAWEFTTQVLGLPKSRLYVSVFEGEGALPRDDEAVALWKKIGVAADHIVALGRADNFWGPAGGQGACGPSSEIYFDLGEKRPDYLPDGVFWGERPGDAGDRFMEFWNLVFPQYDAQKDGTLELLPRPGIDTGMGLERLALIVQDKRTIFDTDVFAPLVEFILGVSQNEYGELITPVHRRDARIIADHARAITFAMSEGKWPGNEGAPYVLRRLLRRAEVRARSRDGLRITGDDFISRVAELVIDMFKSHYSELEDSRAATKAVLDREEMNFLFTYGRGLTFIEDLLGKGVQVVSGEAAFKLHDTYGLSIDVAEEMAAARGLQIDRAAFEREMEKQRERARSSSQFGERTQSEAELPWTVEHEGVGPQLPDYDHLELDQVKLLRWRRLPDAQLEMVLDKTPCYPESGGQVWDRGTISTAGVVARLSRVYREGDFIVHRVEIVEGPWNQLITLGRESLLSAHVDPAHRIPTQRHHTATHLLHSVLRYRLGGHVRQAGSLVEPARLRFDYTHFAPLTELDLREIERLIYEWVLDDREVGWQVLPIAAAREAGAMALFGEKYGELVRVVRVDNPGTFSIAPSLELCGGTHVTRTGKIGKLKIVSESAVASGVRRIEAVCALEEQKNEWAASEILARVASELGSSPTELPEQLKRLKEENEYLKAELVRLAAADVEREMDRLIEGATVEQNARWFVDEVRTPSNAETLRGAADRTMKVLGRGAFVIASRSGGKLTFMAAVSDDLIAEKKLRADELVRAVAKIAGGSGGGKPHLALAGAKEPEKLGASLDEARRLIQQALGA
jgi:alanyl-tRNA synthetase